MSSISPEILLEILVHAQELGGIIIGGQALNLWAERMFDRAPDELRAFAPYTSKDIDFAGTALDAERLAWLLDGKVAFPSSENVSTPNSAIVKIDRDGKEIIIDFLAVMAGVCIEDVRGTSIVLALTGGPLEKVRVLHPRLVFLTRIAGVVVLRRRDDTAVRQLLASSIVLREYIRETLDLTRDIEYAANKRDLIKEAQCCIGEMIMVCCGSIIDAPYKMYGFDPLLHAEVLAEHPAWDSRFAQHQIRARIDKVRATRQKRIIEAERKIARLPA